MAKGGYQIIDFGGASLGETAVTIKGAYAKAGTGKALLLENFMIGESNVLSAFGVALLSSDDYVITIPITGVYNAVITIDDDDAVVAAVVELAEASD